MKKQRIHWVGGKIAGWKKNPFFWISFELVQTPSIFDISLFSHPNEISLYWIISERIVMVLFFFHYTNHHIDYMFFHFQTRSMHQSMHSFRSNNCQINLLIKYCTRFAWNLLISRQNGKIHEIPLSDLVVSTPCFLIILNETVEKNRCTSRKCPKSIESICVVQVSKNYDTVKMPPYECVLFAHQPITSVRVCSVIPHSECFQSGREITNFMFFFVFFSRNCIFLVWNSSLHHLLTDVFFYRKNAIENTIKMKYWITKIVAYKW